MLAVAMRGPYWRFSNVASVLLPAFICGSDAHRCLRFIVDPLHHGAINRWYMAAEELE